MIDPVVDVTIAVHSATRPIARAVGSVLDHTIAAVRVNVVAHNIDPAIIQANLGHYSQDPRLRLLTLVDGIPSPAGPMNYGFANSTAPFAALLGSDDEFAPGAIDSWLKIQRETAAEMVIAKIQLVTRHTDPYPPVRNGRRTHKLSGRKDRLAYRSAPLGLIDRRRFGSMRLAEGLLSGEDLTFSLTLWFTGKNLAYDLEGPAYVGHDDAVDRVTSDPRPLDADFAFLDDLETLPWFISASRADRIAIIAKIIRIHVFDAILARTRSSAALAENRDGLFALLERLEKIAPGVQKVLSRADHAVFNNLKDVESTPETVAHRLGCRYKYLSAPTLLTRNPIFALHSQAPFRTLFAGYRIARRH